jgi:hypothetical protein
MAKLEELSFSLGATVNLGNFESTRVDVGMRVSLEEGDSPKEEYAKLKAKVGSLVTAEVLEIKQAL